VILTLTLPQIAILAASGFIAGMVNAVAGGGTFFSFAALIACGLTSLEANATSSVALTPGYFASILAYREEVKRYRKQVRAVAIIGILGGAAGALILLWIGDAGFRPLVPWLLLLATLLFALSPNIRAAIAPLAADHSGKLQMGAYALLAIVSLYGGFFGAGMGIVLLAALAIIEEGDFHRANAVKAVMSFVIQLVSASILVAGGLVHWQPALVIMTMVGLGGYLGVGLARKVPEKVMRWSVVAVGALLTIYFFIR
jgi:uncharacterized protein